MFIEMHQHPISKSKSDLGEIGLKWRVKKAVKFITTVYRFKFSRNKFACKY